MSKEDLRTGYPQFTKHTMASCSDLINYIWLYFISDLSVKDKGLTHFFHYESRVDLTPFMPVSDLFDFSSLFSLCVYLLMFFLIFSYLFF